MNHVNMSYRKYISIKAIMIFVVWLISLFYYGLLKINANEAQIMQHLLVFDDQTATLDNQMVDLRLIVLFIVLFILLLPIVFYFLLMIQAYLFAYPNFNLLNELNKINLTTIKNFCKDSYTGITLNIREMKYPFLVAIFFIIYVIISNKAIFQSEIDYLIETPFVFPIILLVIIISFFSILCYILKELEKILLQLKPYFSINYLSWIKRIFFYLISGLISISLCHLLFIGRLNKPIENFESARYLISVLIQSEATIIAIVVTLSLVAVQQAASTYSIRAIDIFKENPDFWILTLSYLFAIVYGLSILKQIDETNPNIGSIPVDLQYSIELAYYIGVFVLFALLPYFLNILNLLKPSKIIEELSKKVNRKTILLSVEEQSARYNIDKINIVTFIILIIFKKEPILCAEVVHDNDPFRPIIDIFNRSLISYDYETANRSLDSIEKSVKNILENETFQKEQYEKIFLRLIAHFTNIQHILIRNDCNEFDQRIEADLIFIVKCGVKHQVFLSAQKGIIILLNIGITHLQNGNYDKAKNLIDLITREIDYIHIIQELHLCESLECLKNSGSYSGNEYYDDLYKVSFELIDNSMNIGLISIHRNLNPIVEVIVDLLINIKNVSLREISFGHPCKRHLMSMIAEKANKSLFEIRESAKEQNIFIGGVS